MEKFNITEQDVEQTLANSLISRTPLVLKVFPRKEKKKYILALEIICQFEAGKVYTEAQVNDILKPIWGDFSTVRRALVDFGLLKRTDNGSSYEVVSQIDIRTVADSAQKSSYAEAILRKLPAWFGIEESLLEYVEGVKPHPFYGAFQGGRCLAFFSLMPHHGRNVDIYVCGVDPSYHGQGLGTDLLTRALADFRAGGFEFATVLTLSSEHPDKNYALTRKFYEKMGFLPFYTSRELWGADYPCLMMMKPIGAV